MLAAEFSGFELDDKALLGILCDVFSQKCSAAWQGAPGQRLTVAIMLPAVKMQMTGISCCRKTRSHLAQAVSVQTLVGR